MKPSKPFLFCLALVLATGATVLLNAPSAHAASTARSGQEDPLSTKLTPAMIDFFALDVAYDRPSIQALVRCQATPACGQSDSMQVRFLDATGAAMAAWDDQPGSVIEQVTVRTTPAGGAGTEWRRNVRRYSLDTERRIVMRGTDSIVRTVVAEPGQPASVSRRVHRFNNIKYLVTDPRFLWPLSGLVVLEYSDSSGAIAAHAAVSFDGSASARIITNGALMHRADLQQKRLESTLPER